MLDLQAASGLMVKYGWREEAERMSGSGGEADAIERLEAALDRIAERTEAARAGGPPPDVAAIKARLDRLIGQVRDALADPSAGEA